MGALGVGDQAEGDSGASFAGGRRCSWVKSGATVAKFSDAAAAPGVGRSAAPCILHGSAITTWQTVLHRQRPPARPAGSVLARLRNDGYDWRPRLGGVSASALVIHGEKDVLPLAVAVEISQVLPFARLHIVPTAGHMPFWEAPGTFFSLTETFLISLDAER